uniref:Uncharacterized protein n=1 Tax=Anguilla anguilla TaxID=7936 RepID=A0A0E9S516_ANGAN
MISVITVSFIVSAFVSYSWDFPGLSCKIFSHSVLTSSITCYYILMLSHCIVFVFNSS